MILQNWWYTTLLNTKADFCPPLQKNISCDVLVVGGGMAGLPWAAFCGDYAARRTLNPKTCHDYCAYLTLQRKFFIPSGLQKIIGKQLTFMLNNPYSIFFQKDKKFIEDKSP